MGMEYAEEPFNMGMFFLLPKAFFKLGTFPNPQHTHPCIFILESPPGTLVTVLVVPSLHPLIPPGRIDHRVFTGDWGGGGTLYGKGDRPCT